MTSSRITQMGKTGNKAYINGAIIILNIVYFLYLEIAGSSENSLFMIEKGALYLPLLIEKKQYYRLITSVFMHFGIDESWKDHHQPGRDLR